MRTDLFKRSLNSTLVTDFFGGVARVEVNEQSKDIPIPSHEVRKSSQPLKQEHVPLPPRTSQKNLTDTWGIKAQEKKQTRTWIGTGLLFALIGVVALREQRPKAGK